MLVGGTKFVVREILVAHWLDQGPVSSHRTVQEPVPAELDGFDRHSRNPNSREEVTSPAPYRRDTADAVAAPAGHQRPERKREDNEQ